MASSTKTFITFTLLAAANLVAGHGAITGATGDAGGTGMALGIDTSTPRDGTRRNPFQQDSTRFKGAAANTVGETLGGGTNQLEAGTQAILAETGDSLPQVTAGGSVQMTLHQVNGDGAGPYTCMINADGTAQTWFVARFYLFQSPTASTQLWWSREGSPCGTTPIKSYQTNTATRSNIQVTQQVPGRNSRSNVSLSLSFFPICPLNH